jgi:chromosome segregation ATPase
MTGAIDPILLEILERDHAAEVEALRTARRNEQVEALEARLADLEAELKDAKQAYADAVGELQAARDESKALHDAVNAVESRLIRARHARRRSGDRLKDVEREVRALQARLEVVEDGE